MTNLTELNFVRMENSKSQQYYLYILDCQASREQGVVKFGRTGNLPNRLRGGFRTTFPDASYRYTYKMDKETCFKAEADILAETADLQATYWKTEWRQMSVDRLHKIVMNYLERNQIKFVLEVEPKIGNNGRKPAVRQQPPSATIPVTPTPAPEDVIQVSFGETSCFRFPRKKLNHPNTELPRIMFPNLGRYRLSTFDLSKGDLLRIGTKAIIHGVSSISLTQSDISSIELHSDGDYEGSITFMVVAE